MKSREVKPQHIAIVSINKSHKPMTARKLGKQILVDIFLDQEDGTVSQTQLRQVLQNLNKEKDQDQVKTTKMEGHRDKTKPTTNQRDVEQPKHQRILGNKTREKEVLRRLQEHNNRIKNRRLTLSFITMIGSPENFRKTRLK